MRDRDAKPIAMGQAHSLGDAARVVKDVMVREHCAFRETRGPGRVLEVNNVIEIQLLLALDELARGDLLGLDQQLVPAEHSCRWLRAKENDAPQMRKFFELQVTARLCPA